MEKLEGIEHALGKTLPFRYGPRTIDLDLLLVENPVLPEEPRCKIQDPSTSAAIRYPLSAIRSPIVPHPKLHLRRFVLAPLCELIDPMSKHPTIDRSWRELLENTLDQECEETAIVL